MVGRRGTNGDDKRPRLPTPVNAPLFTEVMSPADLVGGETYESWLCEACGAIIPLVTRPADSEPLTFHGAVVRIPCPHCGKTLNYPVHDFRPGKHHDHRRSAARRRRLFNVPAAR